MELSVREFLLFVFNSENGFAEMGRLGVSDRYIATFCGRTPKLVLARHYNDYIPERLKKIYDDVDLKVLV